VSEHQVSLRLPLLGSVGQRDFGIGEGLVARLFQLRRDRRELGVQLGADAVDDGDDGNGNPGGDQAIFNGGRSGFIFDEGL
jgi:hypothetical protein